MWLFPTLLALVRAAPASDDTDPGEPAKEGAKNANSKELLHGPREDEKG
jgi:hypothetical protein